MRDNPVIPFLKKHWDQDSPVLLGFSGGPDSMALLHLLLQVKIPLHLAHIDHGMREESSSQAEQLKLYAEKLGLPFHLRKLEGVKGGNLEERFRDARRGFFKELCEEIPFQAVLLAHQADDQAEVVLKRIFEGARLYNLGGMSEISKQDHLTIWRPLLKMRKELLLQFLEKRGLPSLDDATNRNTYYLRARMREELFPLLEKKFGKRVRSALCRIGEEASGTKERLSFSYMLEREGVRLNSDQLEKIFEHVQKKSKNKKFILKEGELLLNAGSISLNSRELKS